MRTSTVDLQEECSKIHSAVKIIKSCTILLGTIHTSFTKWNIFLLNTFKKNILLTPHTISLILQPQPLSNDPQFIQFIYQYSHASKRFVEVYKLIDRGGLKVNQTFYFFVWTSSVVPEKHIALDCTCPFRPPYKRAFQKIIFLISQPKHILSVNEKLPEGPIHLT